MHDTKTQEAKLNSFGKLTGKLIAACVLQIFRICLQWRKLPELLKCKLSLFIAYKLWIIRYICALIVGYYCHQILKSFSRCLRSYYKNLEQCIVERKHFHKCGAVDVYDIIVLRLLMSTAFSFSDRNHSRLELKNIKNLSIY